MESGRHEWRLVAPDPAPPGGPELDAAQRAVTAWDRGPAIVYAGPGAGKTSTIVEAALTRIADGAEPSSILILTFGRDAAAELRQRLSLRIGTGEPPCVSTFHAFALDLVLRMSPADRPIRVLTGAEQERAVRDILDGSLAEPILRVRWPADLLDAVGTRGFAKEARVAFAAARGLGMTGEDLAEVGTRAADLAWASIGPVLEDYLEALGQDNSIDYGELLYTATTTLRQDPDVVRGLRHIYVDEYQDTDHMQVGMLKALCEHATSLLVVGDPDQSIYAFRGAEVTNVRDFSDDFQFFATKHGLPKPQTMVLAQTRRYGPAIRDYARAIFGDTAVPGLDVQQSLAHRAPAPAAVDSEVHVFCYDDETAEAAHIASQIRALVQRTGDAWSDIAVLVRAAHAIPTIERALQRANIPVETDVRDSRLVDQPAVRTLLRALDAVSGTELRLEPTHAHELLLSPLCGLDPAMVRGLARALRTDRSVPSDETIASALCSSVPLFELAPDLPGGSEFEALRRLLRDVYAKVRAGATPHEALWLLWSGTQWPVRLRRQAIEHNSAFAHRDLDAVCELFDIADRTVQRRQGRSGVSAFVYELRAQQVPSETLARRGFRGPAVRIMTAHRAKGLEWKHVFVANVTESVWPDLRRRSALLDTDRLTVDGLILPRSRATLFEEERRLFFVACTRAKHTLMVSGIAGLDKDAPQPSRFLDNGVLSPEFIEDRPTRIDSAADLVATLRKTATSEESTPALRAAAIERLRTLAAETDDAGAPLFPEADWRTWWGTREVTANEVPIDALDAPLYVRGSSLETLGDCSLRWLLEQKVHADIAKNSALVFGSVIHALTDAVVKGGLPADAQVLADELRKVWNAAGYASAWQSELDFEEGVAAIGRFLAFHRDHADAPTLSEVDFDRVVDIVTPTGRVERLRMRGSIDRIEITDEHGVIVFDYKTGRTAPGSAEVVANPQLRFYQYAVAAGLLDDDLRSLAGDHEYSPAGGALVQLRIGDGVQSRGPNFPKVQQQPSLEPSWTTSVLGAGLDTVRGEAFVAVAGPHCRYCPMKAICPAQPEGRHE